MSKSKKLIAFVYNIFLILYKAAVAVSSLWNPKAKKWREGRKGLLEEIKSTLADKHSKIVWVHCSSLGEFEQGKPIIKGIRERNSHCHLVLTFFSPSGYEAKKNYDGADHVFYLPMDSKKTARDFLDILNPALVIFVKYDYWYYYLKEIRKRKINCLLVSAVFRRDQPFFRWYGRLQRIMLHCFTQIFVQDQQSKELLQTIHVQNCIVSGDTRFDTVLDIADRFEPIPLIEKFFGNQKCIIAGSTWKADEEALQKAFQRLSSSNVKLIIAPHEIHPVRLNDLQNLFPQSTRFSELTMNAKEITGNVLIIDNMGMLSRLYKYAYITYVGGGFTRDGVHNVLEAAVYGKPVVFGKNYGKYQEAIDLVALGGAKDFSTPGELSQILTKLLSDKDEYESECKVSENYVRKCKGATEKILHYIEENRLLTS